MWQAWRNQDKYPPGKRYRPFVWSGTAAVEAAFCKAPPHTACTPALDKACGKTEHTGKDCTTCCAVNKAVLLKAGCTAAAERAFCAVPV